ncbi:hypothetical protein ACFP47_09405 [Nesterenkonia lacusekhoensis]|uniref:Uncharacterized protein n=1 Tax=Nesterenkonia lacusekhoensis TaxID=150832 RepID=A0ABS4T0J2_9MICC|nr:hypothetical protein [Nesterenkonia lacusekhoensis]MBP2317363.1 hypothetical protein [Nesterenkonia lacusekhoensis]
MDISNTIEAKSDQQNAVDYVSGPRVVTISEVRKGNADQPVELHLVEHPGKPYKPSKSMRRVLVKVWDKDASVYVGRRLELYNEPSVKWAGQPVGGIRISRASDIDAPVKIPLQVAKGKIEHVTVHPLPDAPTSPTGPAMISRGQWEQITTAAANSGITEPLEWAAGFLSRELDGPQQITADEATQLMNSLEERTA